MPTNTKDNTAAHGTAALVLSRGCFFFLGYLAVVLFARELGPADYGLYSFIIAVLVWLEESGRFVVPSATAKLLAETETGQDGLERSALALNFGLHLLFFALLWLAAPWLASWFEVEHGALYFRLAAIDLPLFGLYTVYQAIHQGRRHFVRLGVSQVIYALTKFLGVLVLMALGISIGKALIVNVLATVVGLSLLLPQAGIVWRGAWFEKARAIIAVGIPIGLYYVPLLLRGALLLGVLKRMLPEAELGMIGVLTAALNIARVPAFGLVTVSVVILPSISSALARNDIDLARRYLSQALRFFLILFIPICFALMVEPEWLMQMIYSDAFAGGGLLVSILLVSEGLYTIQTILASSLHAAGQMRATAGVILSALLPSIGILILFTKWAGVVGAALSSAAIPLIGISFFTVMLWRRFGPLMPARSVLRITLAAVVMVVIDALIPTGDGWGMLLHGVGLVGYAVILVALGEVTRQEIGAMMPGRRQAAQTT